MVIFWVKTNKTKKHQVSTPSIPSQERITPLEPTKGPGEPVWLTENQVKLPRENTAWEPSEPVWLTGHPAGRQQGKGAQDDGLAGGGAGMTGPVAEPLDSPFWICHLYLLYRLCHLYPLYHLLLTNENICVGRAEGLFPFSFGRTLIGV